MKKLEDQQKEENVVDAERFLNQLAGEKLKSRSAPVREEYPKSKRNGKRDPHGALQSRFTQGNRVRAPVKQAKVEQQEQRNAGMEGGPERPCAHLGHARFHDGYFEAGHWRKKPQWFESCAVRLGFVALRFVNSTRVVSPGRTVTGKSQRRRTSPEIA
jgi:hypothetical protein